MNLILLRNLLIDNVTPLPSNVELIPKLMNITESSKLEDIDELIEMSVDKIASFHPAKTRQVPPECTPKDVHDAIERFGVYRNKIFQPDNSFIYVKLETGGFVGYDSRTGGLGEKTFPVLRVSLKYNDKFFDVLINPEGKESIISDATKLHLERNGTLTNALASTITIGRANELITEFLKLNGLPKHDPSINRQNILVSANTEFNNKFIYHNLPALRNVAGRPTIDVNLVIQCMASNGTPVVPLNVYGHTPVDYLTAMSDVHQALIQGLTYV